MSPALTVHSGRVYRWKSSKHWKESWLTLESHGHLVWKRKDAYQVKGSVHLLNHLDKITIPSPTDKQIHDSVHPNSYFFCVPMSDNEETKKISLKWFAVFDVRDLELWLDAFAQVTGQWKVYKAVSDKQRDRVAKIKNCCEENLEEVLTYAETVPFLRTIWEEFMGERSNPTAVQEINESLNSPISKNASFIFSQHTVEKQINSINKTSSNSENRHPLASSSSSNISDVLTNSSDEEIVVNEKA